MGVANVSKMADGLRSLNIHELYAMVNSMHRNGDARYSRTALGLNGLKVPDLCRNQPSNSCSMGLRIPASSSARRVARRTSSIVAKRRKSHEQKHRCLRCRDIPAGLL